MQTWILFALLAAVAAACTNLFGKIGMEQVDSTMATAVRGMIMAVFLICVATVRGKWTHLQSLTSKSMLMIVLSGLCGATSWLFGFAALKAGGTVSGVSALDKMSVPIAVVLAVVVLHDKLQALNWVGVALIVAGGYLVAYKP